MSAGPHHEYFWKDGDKMWEASLVLRVLSSFSIPTAAPVYIDYVMTSVQDQLDDENIFPSKIGEDYPVIYFISMLFRAAVSQEF